MARGRRLRRQELAEHAPLVIDPGVRGEGCLPGIASRVSRCSMLINGPCFGSLDGSHGCTCKPYPRLSRMDSMSQNATSGVNTSAAPSTPVYFSMTGAAVASPTALR